MEDKIEIGEFIRTKKGYIRQVVRRDVDDYILLDVGFESANHLTKIEEKEDIVKHSKNLIDLIEVGDLIELRGAEKLKYEVLKISYSPSKGTHIHIINPFRTEGGKDIFIEDIQSIVTKEQFENIKYEVENE